MPIVFVHGVNNRSNEASYTKGVVRKEAFLRSVFAPALGSKGTLPTITFPYWGDHGVKFRWSQASLPKHGADVEQFGLDDAPPAVELELWLAEARFQYGKQAVSLSSLSRHVGFDVAVDLVWDTAAALTAEEPLAAQGVADAYTRSLEYAAKDPAPVWALSGGVTNEAFVTKLLEVIAPEPTPAETFGLSRVFAPVKEALSRIASAPMDAASSVALRFARASAHAAASRFLGDILVYVTSRGTKDAPGPIVVAVVNALEKAIAAKKPGDEALVVIGHSLGGLVVYDVLTYFRPDLFVDTWVTVGSQVALFEEMMLCRASDPGLPANPKTTKLMKPAAVGTWLNVYDTNDVFSFRVSDVFEGPKDFAFDTGYSLLQAHGGYFARPSFYRRLAARLLEDAT